MRGPIHSHVPGRTDHIPTKIQSGSYVIPADVVSGIGEGNTVAGYGILDHLFSKEYGSTKAPRSTGVPVVVAGGEYVVPPEVVQALGRGDIKQGHDVLDKFVVAMRSKIIKEMKALPGPRKD